MPQAPRAAPAASEPAYPRSPFVRGLRLLLRVLWILVLLGGLAAIAPNVWVQYQKAQGLSGLLDPNNLASIFYIPQLTQWLGGNTTLLLACAIGAGALFLVLFFLGLWAGRDARRERRALRQRSTSQPASATAPAATPMDVVTSTIVPLAVAPQPAVVEPAVIESAPPLSSSSIPSSVEDPAGDPALPAQPADEPLADLPPAPTPEPAYASSLLLATEAAPEPSAEPLDEPLAGAIAPPDVEPAAEGEPTPEPAPDPASALGAVPSGEPVVASAAAPVAESDVEPPVAEPVAEPVATLAELAELAEVPVIEPVTPVDEPLTEPVMASISEPVLAPLAPLPADPLAAPTAEPPAASEDEALPERPGAPIAEPAVESVAEQRSPPGATAYSSVLSAPIVPPIPQEAPTMSSLPPQNPPDGSHDTPPAPPNWWTTAPVVPIAPAAPQPPVAPPAAQPYPQPYATPPSQPYANPPSQPYVTPLSQPYVTPLSQPYQPQMPGAQLYPPPQVPGSQPYFPSQMPAGQSYAPPMPGGQPYPPTMPPGAPGGSQGFGQKAMASVPLLASAAQFVGQITAPVQDETGISPAPFTAQAPGWAHTKPLTDAQLGDRIDGWADTVIGMSDKAPLMIQALVQDLPTHFRPATQSLSTRLGMTGMSTLARGIDMPLSPVALVRIAQSIMPTIMVLPRLILRLFGVTIVGKQRDYLFAVTTPGAIVGIMITGAGQDLYMAWDLFLRRVWNEIAIGLLTVIALVVGVIAGFGAVRTASIFASYTSSPSLVLAGAFIGAFISVGLGTFFGVFVVIAILGFIFRRDALAFFRKDIDLFEVHDITSMSLSVHKALLRAADKAGIDSKLLRAKEGFTTDRDKRVI